jgi:hypothetical protein
MTGVLVSRDGAQKVTIRNFSRSGAQVATKDRIPKNADVVLSRGPLFAAARVVWVTGTEAGIKFYRELSPDEVEDSLPEVVISRVSA